MTRPRSRLSWLVVAVSISGALGCPSMDVDDTSPSSSNRVPEAPAVTPTPPPTATPRPPSTATPAPTVEPTRDPRGARCELCSNDAECRPPLRCFPFSDGRSRCDNVNPGPPC